MIVEFVPRWGATVCGARKLLVAFNINVLVHLFSSFYVGNERTSASYCLECSHQWSWSEGTRSSSGIEGNRLVCGGLRYCSDFLQSQ